MTTEQIKSEVQRFAPTAKSIWPNGLGFNWRGWEYPPGYRGWGASRDGKCGFGSTPLEARILAVANTEDEVYVTVR